MLKVYDAPTTHWIHMLAAVVTHLLLKLLTRLSSISEISLSVFFVLISELFKLQGGFLFVIAVIMTQKKVINIINYRFYCPVFW